MFITDHLQMASLMSMIASKQVKAEKARPIVARKMDESQKLLYVQVSVKDIHTAVLSGLEIFWSLQHYHHHYHYY